MFGVIYSKFERYSQLLFTFALLSALSGCATAWTAKVTTFEAWNEELFQARYFIPATPEQEGSLAFQTVADMIRVSMGAAGLVEGDAASRLYVRFDYSSAVTEQWEERFADPFFGGLHPYAGIWGGSGYYYNGIGLGGVFYSPRLVSVPVKIYQNMLDVEIVDRFNNDNELYKVRVVNESNSENLMEVMPLMAKAAFVDFPGSNGKTKHIKFKRKP